MIGEGLPMTELFDDLPELSRPEPVANDEVRLRRAERDQVELRPVSIDELVGADHLSRRIWHLVGGFDLAVPTLASV